MPSMEDVKEAMKTRSLRTIQTELQYLADTSVITAEQLSNILSQLPQATQLRTPVINQINTTQADVVSPPKEPSNEKRDLYGATVPVPSFAPPPPAYGSPPTLAWATALYAYNPTDAGDVAILPNDRIAVLEYMNAEWWKGRNERTGQEGIFPRNYVKVLDDRSGFMTPTVAAPMTPNYVNMPMDVSQGGSNPVDPRKPSKFEEHGKKFGRKLGDATIFGAGATMGSKIVSGIF